jgi:predicted porin
MNKKLGLAVAGALLAASASAQAGITIPAGDWTLDINGNVNAFMQTSTVDKHESVIGSVHVPNSGDVRHGIGTGLLPSWLGFTGKTRQNDLDVEFTISLQPGASNNTVHGDGSAGGESATFLNRQTYVKFGDASWGSIKIGKDLGIYGSTAILNDMTLLGVGAFHTLGQGLSGASINTTTGGIGSGYQYAAWRGQLTYQSPNWNGFQATIGLMNPNQVGPETENDDPQSRYGVEGQLAYSWTGDVSGKVWTSFANYRVKNAAGDTAMRTGATNGTTISAFDLGANVNFSGLGLTAYGYTGSGNGTATFGYYGIDQDGKKRDGSGGYLQATYVIPTGTKLGVAYGVTKVDDPSNYATFMDKDRRWTLGAYHPLTKNLNLVAEYNNQKVEANGSNESKYETYSLGAILFF